MSAETKFREELSDRERQILELESKLKVIGNVKKLVRKNPTMKAKFNKLE